MQYTASAMHDAVSVMHHDTVSVMHDAVSVMHHDTVSVIHDAESVKHDTVSLMRGSCGSVLSQQSSRGNGSQLSLIHFILISRSQCWHPKLHVYANRLKNGWVLRWLPKFPHEDGKDHPSARRIWGKGRCEDGI
jgi:hypothetical protein